mgnify:CR=1 FL=1
MKYFLFVLALLCGLPISGQILDSPGARDLDSLLTGSWSGDVFNAVGARNRVIINFTSFKRGPCDATWDLPTYGWIGNRFSRVSCADGNILLQDDSADVVFTGVYTQSPLAITGTWVQRRTNSPVVFRKLYEAKRIQEPGPQPPFLRIPLSIPNRPAGVMLGAELIIPDTLGRYPLAILAGDRELTDRDARDQSGHAPYLILAALLAERNIATLRIDDRGTGLSTGIADPESIDDEASDIGAALERLRRHPNVDTTRIVVIGHGEGGLAATVVANRYPTISRLVFMGTPATNGTETLLGQIAARERARETDEELIGVAVSMVRAWCAEVLRNRKKDSVVFALLRITDSVLAARPDLLDRYPLARQLQQPGREDYMVSTLLPWLWSYLWYSPAPYFDQLRQPVLALYAERDTEVPAAIHAPALATYKMRGSRVVIETIPNVNHWFQPCDVCDADERLRTELSISTNVVARISRWILQGR